MLIENWGPDFMDPHTNADTFARNTDNSDAPKSKPLAWRNSWDIPELSKRTDMAVRERDADKRKQMYLDLQKDVMDQGPIMISRACSNSSRPIPAAKRVAAVSRRRTV